MKRIRIAIVLPALLLLSAAQEEESGRDAAVRKTLTSTITLNVGVANLTLKEMADMLDEFTESTLAYFVDPVEVRDPAKIRIIMGQDTLDGILRASLKPLKLEHFVWEGVVVITSPKGAAAFKSPAWLGFSRKSVDSRKELSKKLSEDVDCDWNPLDPAKAVEALAQASGVEINAAKLKGVKAAPADDRRLFPRHTSLYGALVFLSRSSGVTFEVTRTGSLTAKAPAARK